MKLRGLGGCLLGALLTAGCGAAAAGPSPAAGGTAGTVATGVQRSRGVPGAGESVQAVAFATNSRGWVTVTGNARSPRGQILATTDGGRSWTMRWHGTGTPDLLEAVNASRAFATVDHCGLPALRPCATTLLAATASGRWAPVWSTPAHVTSMAFADGSRGIAALRRRPCPLLRGSSPVRCPGELVRTVDGGRRWRTVLSLDDPLVAVATNGRRWWAVESALGIARPPSSLYLTVWSSADGATWRKVGRIGGIDILSGQAHARMLADARGGLWLSFLDQGSCAMHGCATDGLWHSINGGAAWASVTPQPPATGGCGLSGSPVIGADPAGAVRAADGRPQATCSPPAATLFTWSARRWKTEHAWARHILTAMSWPSARTGYAVVGGRIQKTTDAGASWHAVPSRS